MPPIIVEDLPDDVILATGPKPRQVETLPDDVVLAEPTPPARVILGVNDQFTKDRNLQDESSWGEVIGRTLAQASPAIGKAGAQVLREVVEFEPNRVVTVPMAMARHAAAALDKLGIDRMGGQDEEARPAAPQIAKGIEEYKQYAEKNYPWLQKLSIDNAIEQMKRIGGVSKPKKTSEYLTDIADKMQEIEDEWAPNVVPGSAKAQVAGAMGSIGRMIPAIGIGTIGRRPDLALEFMAAESGAEDAYAKRKAGMSPEEATAAGLINRFVEKYTEKLPLEFALKRGTPFWKRLAQTNISDLPGETIATLVEQGIIDPATVDPNKTVADLLDDVKDTLIQTSIIDVLFAGMGHAAQPLRRKAETRQAHGIIKNLAVQADAGLFNESMLPAVKEKMTAKLGADHPVIPMLDELGNEMKLQSSVRAGMEHAKMLMDNMMTIEESNQLLREEETRGERDAIREGMMTAQLIELRRIGGRTAADIGGWTQEDERIARQERGDQLAQQFYGVAEQADRTMAGMEPVAQGGTTGLEALFPEERRVSRIERVGRTPNAVLAGFERQFAEQQPEYPVWARQRKAMAVRAGNPVPTDQQLTEEYRAKWGEPTGVPNITKPPVAGINEAQMPRLNTEVIRGMNNQLLALGFDQQTINRMNPSVKWETIRARAPEFAKNLTRGVIQPVQIPATGVQRFATATPAAQGGQTATPTTTPSPATVRSGTIGTVEDIPVATFAEEEIPKEEIDRLIPYAMQGNKTALIANYIGKLVRMMSGKARRVIDAFGGAGAYTHFIRSIGNGKGADVWNEYDPFRYVTMKQIRDNPEAVAEAIIRHTRYIDTHFLADISDGTSWAPLHDERRAAINVYLRKELGKHIVEGQNLQELREKKHIVEMKDIPEVAGLYFIAQNNSYNYQPLSAEFLQRGTGFNLKVSAPSFITKIQPKKGAGGHVVEKYHRINKDRLMNPLPYLSEMSARLQNLTIQKGDGWGLIRDVATAGDLVPVDTSYLDMPGAKTDTVSYNEDTKEDTKKDVWLRKVDENLLPAWDRGAALIITNNLDLDVARELEMKGFTILRGERGQGVSKNRKELIAINFDPATGAVYPRGVQRGGVSGRAVPEVRAETVDIRRHEAGGPAPERPVVARPSGEIEGNRVRGAEGVGRVQPGNLAFFRPEIKGKKAERRAPGRTPEAPTPSAVEGPIDEYIRTKPTSPAEERVEVGTAFIKEGRIARDAQELRLVINQAHTALYDSDIFANSRYYDGTYPIPKVGGIVAARRSARYRIDEQYRFTVDNAIQEITQDIVNANKLLMMLQGVIGPGVFGVDYDPAPQATKEKRIGKITVNVVDAWTHAAKTKYGDRLLGDIGIREALQNSLDAVNERIQTKGITNGIIEITLDDVGTHTMSIEDNGIGMDDDTIADKFLSLHSTGKAKQGRFGGFGIAKAVILAPDGSAKWTLHTRDNYFDSDMAQNEERIQDATKRGLVYRNGTKVTVQTDKDIWSQPLVKYINPTEFPSNVTVTFNGRVVTNPFVGIDSADTTGSIDSKTKYTLKYYPFAPTGYQKTLIVRIVDPATGAKLTQFTEDIWNEGFQGCLIYDIKTSLTPRDVNYPFPDSRMNLTNKARKPINDIISQYSVDTISARRATIQKRTVRLGSLTGWKQTLDNIQMAMGATIMNKAGTKALNDDKKRKAAIEDAKRYVEFVDYINKLMDEVESTYNVVIPRRLTNLADIEVEQDVGVKDTNGNNVDRAIQISAYEASLRILGAIHNKPIHSFYLLIQGTGDTALATYRGDDYGFNHMYHDPTAYKTPWGLSAMLYEHATHEMAHKGYGLHNEDYVINWGSLQRDFGEEERFIVRIAERAMRQTVLVETAEALRKEQEGKINSARDMVQKGYITPEQMSLFQQFSEGGEYGQEGDVELYYPRPRTEVRYTIFGQPIGRRDARQFGPGRGVKIGSQLQLPYTQGDVALDEGGVATVGSHTYGGVTVERTRTGYRVPSIRGRAVFNTLRGAYDAIDRAAGRPVTRDDTPRLFKTSDELTAPTGPRVQMGATAVQSVADAFISGMPNASTVKAVPTLRDLPIDFIQRAKINIEKDVVYGGWDPRTDTIYLVADTLHNPNHARRVLIEELIGHKGLEGIIKPGDHAKLAAMVYEQYKDTGLMKAIAKSYKADVTTPKGRFIVGNEFIVHHWKGVYKDPTMMQKIISWFRDVLRRWGIVHKYTNNDLKALMQRAFEAMGSNKPLPYEKKYAAESAAGMAPAKSPVFYSQMERVLDRKLPGVFSAAQAKQLIATWAAKGEYKQEELDWSNVNEWLDSQTGKITKADILSFLRNDAVELEEHSLPEEATLTDDELEQRKEEIQAKVEELADEIVERRMEQWYPDLPKPKAVFNEDYQNWSAYLIHRFADPELIDHGFDTKEEALNEAQYAVDEMEIQARADAESDIRNDIYYDDLEREAREELGYDEEEEDRRQPAYERWTLFKPTNNYRELLYFVPSDTTIWEAPHFGDVGYDANLLAHARVQDVYLSDGRKILFIEELQSDWHEKGRKTGYKLSEEELATLTNALTQLYKRRSALVQKIENDFDVEPNNFWRNENNETIEQYSMRLYGTTKIDPVTLAAYKKAYPGPTPEDKLIEQIGKEKADQYIALNDELGKVNFTIDAMTKANDEALSRVPNAMYKKTWHEFLLKKMMRKAAEEGYAGIAWTPGDVQNKRWSLSKYVSKISWTTSVVSPDVTAEVDSKVDQYNAALIEQLGDNLGKKFAITRDAFSGNWQPQQYLIKAYDVDGAPILTKNVDDENLESVVGKELADKIRKGTQPLPSDVFNLSNALKVTEATINGREIRWYDGSTDIYSTRERAENELIRRMGVYTPFDIAETIDWSDIPDDRVLTATGSRLHQRDDGTWEIIEDRAGEPFRSLPFDKYDDAMRWCRRSYVAQQLKNGRNEYHDSGGELVGNSLEIGGSGMKGFYDKMVPDFLNKYTKKWGAKVEQVDIVNNNGSPPLERSLLDKMVRRGLMRARANNDDQSAGALVRMRNELTVAGLQREYTQATSRQLLRQWLRTDGDVLDRYAPELTRNPIATNKTTPMPGVLFTEAMTNAVLYEGQPRFKKGLQSGPPVQYTRSFANLRIGPFGKGAFITNEGRLIDVVDAKRKSDTHYTALALPGVAAKLGVSQDVVDEMIDLLNKLESKMDAQGYVVEREGYGEIYDALADVQTEALWDIFSQGAIRVRQWDGPGGPEIDIEGLGIPLSKIQSYINKGIIPAIPRAKYVIEGTNNAKYNYVETDLGAIVGAWGWDDTVEFAKPRMARGLSNETTDSTARGIPDLDAVIQQARAATSTPDAQRLPQGNDTRTLTLEEGRGLVDWYQKRFGKGFESTDLSRLAPLISNPYMISKNDVAVRDAFDTQMDRQEDRSKMLFNLWNGDANRVLGDYFGEDYVAPLREAFDFNLAHAIDAVSDDKAAVKELEDLTWKWENKAFPKDRVPTPLFHRIMTGADIRINPQHYTETESFLKSEGVSEKVLNAFMAQRKTLDAALVVLDKVMRIEKLSPELVEEYRGAISEIPNYFPHKREGNAYVSIVKKGSGDEQDRTIYREHYFTYHDRALPIGKKARDRAEQYITKGLAEGWQTGSRDDYVIKQDEVKVLPDEAFYSIPVDAMQQLIDTASRSIQAERPELDLQKVISSAVADTLKSRGFGRHSIMRKDVPGFKKDATVSTLFEYLSGFAGFTTKISASQKFSKILRDVKASETPRRYQYVSRYVKDMLANQDSVDRLVDGLRSIFFIKYLGGVIKSGFVNLTQNVVMAAPILSMYTPHANLLLAKAMKDTRQAVTSKEAWTQRAIEYSSKNFTKDELEAIHELVESGSTADLLLKEIKGSLPDQGWTRNIKKTIDKAGIFMSLAEKYNRTSTGIAAYRAGMKMTDEKLDGIIAKEDIHVPLEQTEQGADIPATKHQKAVAFAKKIIRDSHFVYGKANLPEMMRGGTPQKWLRAPYTFRSYAHNYLLMMYHLIANQGWHGRVAVARSVRNLFLIGGLTSVPFFKMFADMLKAVLGDDDEDVFTNIRSMLPDKWMKDLAVYGLPGLAGIDLSGSLNIEVPQNAGEILGVPYAAYEDIQNMIKSYKSGQKLRAATESPFTPLALRNAVRAYELYTEGQRSRSGADINYIGQAGPRKITGTEAVAKGALGFQPVSMSKGYAAYEATKGMEETMRDKKKAFADRWVNAYRQRDYKEMAAIYAEVDKWNKKAMQEREAEKYINLKTLIKERLQLPGKDIPKFMKPKAAKIAEEWR